MPELGLSLGLAGASSRRATGGAVAFDPRQLFADGEAGAWWDPGDAASLFADAAGTMPAVPDGPVGRIADRSGRGNAAVQPTAAARPTLRRDANGRAYLGFDGIDDWLGCQAAELRFTGPMTLAVAARRETDGVHHVWASAQTFAGTVNQYEFRTDPSGTLELVAAGDGSYELSGGSTALPMGLDRVMTAARTGTAIDFTVRAFDASAAETMASAPHDIVPTSDAASEFRLGSRKGSPLFASGRVYATLAIGRVLTSAEAAGLRGYLAARAGLAA